MKGLGVRANPGGSGEHPEPPLDTPLSFLFLAMYMICEHIWADNIAFYENN